MKKTHSNVDPCYDLFEDFDLIVSSFLTQYGIRVYSKDFMLMKWDEFSSLLSGLSIDTPLGKIIQIRSEDNPDKLKYFTAEQTRIRSEWKAKKAKQVSQEELNAALEELKNAFIDLAK